MERTVSKARSAYVAANFFTALVLAAFCFATVFGIRPFASAMLLALTFSGMPLLVYAPVYTVFSMLAAPSFAEAGVCLVTLAACGIGRLVTIKRPKSRKWSELLFALLAQAGLIFNWVSGDITALQLIVWAVCSVGMTYAFRAFTVPVLVNKLRYRLLETELIACAAVVAVFALGLACAPAAHITVPLAGAAAVLIAGYLSGSGTAAITGIFYGLGAGVHSLDLQPIALFAFMAAVGGIFLGAPRVLSALAVGMAYVIFVYFFNTYLMQPMLSCAAVLAGGAVYALIPRKLLDGARSFLCEKHSAAAARNLINRMRKKSGDSLKKSAAIFSEMGDSISRCAPESGEDYLGSIKQNVCAECPSKARCATVEGMDGAIDALARSSAAKGRVGVSEMPHVLSENCSSLTGLLSYVSRAADGWHAQAERRDAGSAARTMASESYYGMSEVLMQLGSAAGEACGFDRAAEKRLCEELNYRKVVTSEVLIGRENVTVVARSETFDRAQTEIAVSRQLKKRFSVTDVDTDELAGFSVVTLGRSPTYDAVFSCAEIPFGSESGDSHSFIKIGSNRFMMALCDGMGKGKEAAAVSRRAVALAESFYRAGFGHDIVLSSINNFLALSGSERYSTLDICVIDLESGSADVIKFGAPDSVIRQKDGVKVVSGSALPLGVMTDAQPSLTRLSLSEGDMVILMSDGVADAYDTSELITGVEAVRSTNPATVSREILSAAVRKSGGSVRDDSTVLCARMFAPKRR